MSREEAIEILSDMRAEYNLFGDEEEATRYHVLSWAIQEIKAAQQWIPCSERQPEETNLYWVTVKPIDSEILEVTPRWYFGRGYGDGWEAELYEPPLAWMPMEWPEPWRGETDDSM